MIDLGTLSNRTRKSPVFRAGAAYAVFAFIVVQVATLIQDPFGLNQAFMQTLIWVFLIGFPILLIVAGAVSSRFSTLKILGVFGGLLLLTYGGGTYIWVKASVMPVIQSALEKDDYLAAWKASQKIDAYAPFFSSTKLLDESISTIAKIEVTQSDAAIYWRPYAEQSYTEWEYLGHSPQSEFRLPNGLVELKLEKESYETSHIVSANPSPRFNNMSFNPAPKIAPVELQPVGSIPPGMVYVSPGSHIPVAGDGISEVNLRPFYIDKNEVSNKLFKEFIDAGGYEKREFWKNMEIVREGVSLTFEEAKKYMVDSTGLIGPAGWEVGTYLDGQGEMPVTGLTWYEALAYARFRGNILPPMNHWAAAAYPPFEIVAPISPKLIPNSNFANTRLRRTGKNGLGPYGTYDMVGNAREWVWNIFGGVGMTMGGAYSDPSYMAAMQNPLPRFDRSLINGFRTARLLSPQDMTPFDRPVASYENKGKQVPYKTMSDDVFELYSSTFSVSPIDLKADSLYQDESNDLWIKERVNIELGYESSTMDILIFRPKNQFEPLESVIFHPGLNYYMSPPDIDEVSSGEFGLDFRVKSGRAVVWPALKGTMNRLFSSKLTKDSPWSEQARAIRETNIHWRIDTHRTIDYLQERPDFDADSVFYLGMSAGSNAPTHTLLFETRYKAAVLYVGGGTPYSQPPVSDGHNHIPRIMTPILMLNGEQDYIIPKTRVEKFFNDLGTPIEDKKLIFFNSGHWPLPRNQMIKETLGWIEKY